MYFSINTGGCLCITKMELLISNENKRYISEIKQVCLYLHIYEVLVFLNNQANKFYCL